MRTTLDIDDHILKEVKAIQEKERLPIGVVISALLAEALARRSAERACLPFRWIVHPMNSLVDLGDMDAVYAAFDADRP